MLPAPFITNAHLMWFFHVFDLEERDGCLRLVLLRNRQQETP